MNVDALWPVSAGALSTVAAITIVALLGCQRNLMNPLQYFGMALVFLGVAARLRGLLAHGDLDGSTMPPLAQLSLHIGLAVYAVGSTISTLRRRGKGDR